MLSTPKVENKLKNTLLPFKYNIDYAKISVKYKTISLFQSLILHKQSFFLTLGLFFLITKHIHSIEVDYSVT